MNRVTSEQILSECTYAVQCCINHYCDECLSEDGWNEVKNALRSAIYPQGSGIEYRDCVEDKYRHFRDCIKIPWDLPIDYDNQID